MCRIVGIINRRIKMNGRARNRMTFTMLIILLIGVASLANVATKQIRAAVNQKDLATTYLNVTEKYLNFNSKKTRSFDFDIKQDAQEKGAKYSWYVKEDKGDANVVTINSKTGLVTAKKAGTAFIGCKITRADGTVIRPEAKVIVRNNIIKVDISNLPKDRTILAGNATDFNRSILDTDAGKKVTSAGITRWEIKDDFAGVIKATDSGVVFPAKEGDFYIRAVCFQSKGKYNLWLKDKVNNAKNLTAASEWYLVNVKDSDGKAVVADKEQLEKALAADNIKEITLSTKKDISLIIKKGDYKDKSLIVDAPNAEIENFAVFKSVTIAAIKENTWSENAQGNSFHVTSIKIRIIVNEEAEIRDIIIDREDTEIEIEINGTIQRITVLQSAELNLSGDGEEVPITIEKTGSGTRITTSIPVEIKAEEETEIKVLPGAEGTRIEKSSKDIKVKVENNSEQTVSITSEDGEEEVIKAGESGTSDGSKQPTPTTIPIPSGGDEQGGYNPPPATIESIAIKTPATKTTYKVGESLDIAGLTIEGTYSDGGKKAETITTANITGFNSAAVIGGQTLTVTVGGKTTTYTIAVNKADGPALTGVTGNDALNTMIGMTSAMEFSTDGATWTGYYEEIPNLPELTSTIKLYVRNKETNTHTAGPAKEYQFNLGVLESITIKKPADKLIYTVGEPLDITGLIIQGNYSDGGVREEAITKDNITGFDSSNTMVNQEITITIGGKEETYTVQMQPIPLKSITITGDSWVYESLTASIVPEDATADISWLISDTLNGDYEVIPGENGEHYDIRLGDAGKYIKSTATGKVNYDCTVTSIATEMIQAYVEEIRLDKEELVLYEGREGYTLSLTIFPAEATDKTVIWESSDDAIVKVENGVVTPVSEGTAVITVTARTGLASATCNVTVKDTTPSDMYSGIIGIDSEILGSKQITLFISINNSVDEGIPDLSASDFTVDIIHGSNYYEAISLTDSNWFETFKEIDTGVYEAVFKGEKNNEPYTLYNLKVKGVMIHEEPYSMVTPKGVSLILLKATVREDGKIITLEFDKTLQTPNEDANIQFKLYTDEATYLPIDIALKEDSRIIELYVPDDFPILRHEVVILDYEVDASSDILIKSEDEGFLAEIHGYEVDNQSLVTINTSIEPNSLTESVENKGSLISGAIIICLEHTYINPAATKEDILAVNLPEGMDYSVSIDESNKVIEIIISGSALNHADINDINNLHFIIKKEIIAKATKDIVTDNISIDFITPSMIGVVSIIGSNIYGETLTADISALVHVGTPIYTWLRNGEAITGATEKNYTLSEEDIGELISVRVTADGLTGSGSITSATTDEILKGNGSVLTGVAADDADNTIAGMNSLMEFSTDNSNWISYKAEGLALVDLTKDVMLWIRFSETGTHNAGPATCFEFSEGILEKIEIKDPADKTIYVVGDALDIMGLVIKGNYSDGGERDIEIDTSDIIGFDSDNVAITQKLTISIGGCSVTYNITINAKPLESIGNINGTVKAEELLMAGDIIPEAATVNYQWLISDTLTGTYVPVPGATELKYTTSSDDIGKYIRVSATGVGNYTGTVYSEATSEVLPIGVTGVSLDKEAISLIMNWGIGTINATVEPYNATNPSVIWTSSDETVAWVDEYGEVNPVGIGTATITITTVDGGYKASCEVTVELDTIPYDEYSGFTSSITDDIQGSKIVLLSITVKNKLEEGLSGLTADDFRVDIDGVTVFFTDATYFKEFTDKGNGNYEVKFIGQINACTYTLQNLKMQDYAVHDEINARTPDGIPPTITSIEVSEEGTEIIITFDKTMLVPADVGEDRYTIVVDGVEIQPNSMYFYGTDQKQIGFGLSSDYIIYKEAEVRFSYTETFTSADRGFLEGQSDIEVSNGSTVSGIIDSTTILIPPARAGSYSATVADIEMATKHADFTVTDVTWSGSINGRGAFGENALITATVVLTSKNNKQFQAEPFIPSVAGASTVSGTSTSGSETGNTVSFTVTYTSGFILHRVAGDFDGMFVGSGTLESPRIWSISVDNSKDCLWPEDIVPIENGTARLFSQEDFTGEITGSDYIPLVVGVNTVYITVTTPDTATYYYVININRAKILSNNASLVSVLGQMDTSPSGTGNSVFDQCDWEITVENEAMTLNISDIVQAEFAYMRTYGDNRFDNLISLPISLKVGITDIYIRIDSEDSYVSKYYNVRINRLPAKEIESVEVIDDITVEYGTALSSIGLPAHVQVSLMDTSTQKLSVSWDTGTPEYNGSLAGIYTFEGTLTVPAGLENTLELKAIVKVIVNAKELGKGRLTAVINEQYSDGADRLTYYLDKDDYTTDSWAAYVGAINTAISCELDGEAIQVQIDDAIDNIGLRKDELVFAGNEALHAAKALAGGLDQSNHSPENWEALTLALALPETTNAEILTKTTAINIALVVLNIELVNADISAAITLIPTSITVVEEVDTYLLTILQAISGMEELGVTLTIGSSDNSNIASDGIITYTDTEVTGIVTVNINKADGAQQTASVSITVPKKITYAIKFYNDNLSYDFGAYSPAYTFESIMCANYIQKADDSGTITNLEYHFEGPNPEEFIVVAVNGWSTILAEGDYIHIQYGPIEGLSTGSYQATLVITADHGISVKATLKFRVV